KQCTFTAAVMDGKPVASIVQLSADFVPPPKPWTLDGTVVGELGEPLANAEVGYGGETNPTAGQGHFSLHFQQGPPGEGWVLGHPDAPANKGFPEVLKAALPTGVRHALPKEKVLEPRVEGSRLLPPVPDADKTPQVSRFVITRADMDRNVGGYEDVART